MPAGGAPVFSGAVEGDIDEAALRRICGAVGIVLGTVHGRNGKSGLLRSLPGYNAAARFAPWAILVDLDHDCDCAPPCRERWLPEPAASMCCRIAVRALEAWLLSDRERMASFLGVRPAQVPADPETLPDPKESLIALARRSPRRDIKEGIPPRAGSGRRIGPLYTAQIMGFIEDPIAGWRPEIAAETSDSLRRCMRHLRRIADGLPRP